MTTAPTPHIPPTHTIPAGSAATAGPAVSHTASPAPSPADRPPAVLLGGLRAVALPEPLVPAQSAQVLPQLSVEADSVGASRKGDSRGHLAGQRAAGPRRDRLPRPRCRPHHRRHRRR